MAGTGDFIVTCTFETREATGDGDRLAHNPEVMARAVPAGLVWAKQTAAGANLCVGRPQCYVRLRSSESVFIKCGPGVGG
jgi:hypothetical protein